MDWSNRHLPKGLKNIIYQLMSQSMQPFKHLKLLKISKNNNMFRARLCTKHLIHWDSKGIRVQYFKCRLKHNKKDFKITINLSSKSLMKYWPHLQRCKWLRAHILNVRAKWRGPPLSNRCTDQIKAWVVAVVASALCPLTWKWSTNLWEILSKRFLEFNLHSSNSLKNSIR